MVLEDNQKIGIGMICLGLGLVILGVILFFDTSLIAIGNVLFLLGLCLTIGIRRSITLFTRKDRIRGTVCFFTGIVLVLLKWGLVGICIEGFGFLNLFGNFLPTVLVGARQIPVLRQILDLPGISHLADFIVGKTRPKYSV